MMQSINGLLRVNEVTVPGHEMWKLKGMNKWVQAHPTQEL